MRGQNVKLSPTTAAAVDVVRQASEAEILPGLLEKKLSLERWQAVATLKELSETGYGTFVIGRRGAQTRLEKADPFPEPVDDKKMVDEIKDLPANDDCQIFLLRRSPSVHIRVPADLKRDEAEKLGKWLSLIAVD